MAHDITPEDQRAQPWAYVADHESSDNGENGYTVNRDAVFVNVQAHGNGKFGIEVGPHRFTMIGGRVSGSARTGVVLGDTPKDELYRLLGLPQGVDAALVAQLLREIQVVKQEPDEKQTLWLRTSKAVGSIGAAVGDLTQLLAALCAMSDSPAAHSFLKFIGDRLGTA